MRILKMDHPQKFPDQYHETCQHFTLNYISHYQSNIRENLGLYADKEFSSLEWDKTPLAGLLSDIARAAAREIIDDPAGCNRAEIADAIQIFRDLTFAPNAHQSPIGQMVAIAQVWVSQDKLITQAEAAELAETSISNIGQYIAKGKLIGYIDPLAPTRQGRTKVSYSKVQELFPR